MLTSGGVVKLIDFGCAKRLVSVFFISASETMVDPGQ